MNGPDRMASHFSVPPIAVPSISWRGGLNGEWVRLIALKMIRFRYGTGTRAVVVVVPARLRKKALFG